MSDPLIFPSPGGEAGLIKLGLDQAEADHSISFVASTYSSDDDRVYDGVSRDGIRVVTFSPILKSKIFPLDDIIRFLLHLGNKAMNCPVEIEYAADFGPDRSKPCHFYFLQIRPMPGDSDTSTVSVEGIESNRILCRSAQSLGNGHINNIVDILYVNPEGFSRAQMGAMANEIGRFNADLKAKGRKYLLIGPGRWGTSDRWLGIPVSWSQISEAMIIVEAAYGDFSVAPSFGTHFFQNLISYNMGYLTVEGSNSDSFMDWDWLSQQTVTDESEHVSHLSLKKPLEILIDGRVGKAVVLKPKI